MLNSIFLHSNTSTLINRFQDETCNLAVFNEPGKGCFHSRYYPYNQNAHTEPRMLYYHLSKDLHEICKYQSHHFAGAGSKDIVLPQQKTLLLALVLAHICQPCCVTRAHAHLGDFARAACLSLYEILLIKKSLLWVGAEASRWQCCYVISSVVGGWGLAWYGKTVYFKGRVMFCQLTSLCGNTRQLFLENFVV